MNSHPNTHTKHLRNDILLFAILFLIGASAFIYQKHKFDNAPVSNIAMAIIKADGKTLDPIDLSKDGYYAFKTEAGFNHVIVENGTIQVVKSDCPDRICVNHAPISKKGEVIICLPHKLEITIIESEESIDAVAE